MKKFFAAVLIFCLAFSLTACGGDKTPSETGDGATKDTLVWVQSADVTSLDPHVGKETPAVTVTCQIFDTLLTMDENNQPAPVRVLLLCDGLWRSACAAAGRKL